MVGLSVVLALLAALGNAFASVLQRRAAAVEEPGTSGSRLSWLVHLLHRRVWLYGVAVLVLSAVCQGGALATGPLAVVQPVMTTELPFTLVAGGMVFRRRPDARTWWAFLAMAAGLAALLLLADPSAGSSTVPGRRWLFAAMVVPAVVVVLCAVSLRLRPAPRAAVLGTATAIGFSCTAALMKDTLGGLGEGVGAFLATWQPYAFMGAGLASFLLLQLTLHAGTLAASQPALTLGDALLSVVLGVALFDERVVLGARIVPEVAALLLIAVGSVQLARSPLVSGKKGEQW